MWIRSTVRSQLLSCPPVDLCHSPSHDCWDEASLEFSHWPGISEKATLSDVKYLEPGLKCSPRTIAARSAGRLVGESEISHGHAVWASESSFISRPVSYSDLSLWRWKISTFSSWSCCYLRILSKWLFSPRVHALWMCYYDESLYLCAGVGEGGCCKCPTELNWLVSAKCGRGLTSMFQSASWVGRCKMIHQLSGKEHTALLLCCPVLLRLCSSALDGIFASSGSCVSLY